MAKENKSAYRTIGVMAGSSMDGLDVAEVVFRENGAWTFELIKSETFPYDADTHASLKTVASKPIEDQKKLDARFGDWIADRVVRFGVSDIDLVAVHGHTIVHKPKEGISWQLGRGDIIANAARVETITDFRTLDVSCGGQGAPLVPVGDFELFSSFDACVNLGGIANVSVKSTQTAWDICPCNQVLDYYARRLGFPYDEGGALAGKGNHHQDWYDQLLAIDYFHSEPPKSLPNQFLPMDLLQAINDVDGLTTYSNFIVDQIIRDLRVKIPAGSKILVTGGGAHNHYLIEKMNSNIFGLEFVVPSQEIVNYKEAIIFAFLGLLRFLNKTNVLASVTGATRNSCSGEIHFPK